MVDVAVVVKMVVVVGINVVVVLMAGVRTFGWFNIVVVMVVWPLVVLGAEYVILNLISKYVSASHCNQLKIATDK